MPVMDGFEAVQRIRMAEVGARRVPIVALTANVTSSDMERCSSVGVDYFLAKPINMDQLLATVERLGNDIEAKLAGLSENGHWIWSRPFGRFV